MSARSYLLCLFVVFIGCDDTDDAEYAAYISSLDISGTWYLTGTGTLKRCRDARFNDTQFSFRTPPEPWFVSVVRQSLPSAGSSALPGGDATQASGTSGGRQVAEIAGGSDALVMAMGGAPESLNPNADSLNDLGMSRDVGGTSDGLGAGGGRLSGIAGNPMGGQTLVGGLNGVNIDSGGAATFVPARQELKFDLPNAATSSVTGARWVDKVEFIYRENIAPGQLVLIFNGTLKADLRLTVTGTFIADNESVCTVEGNFKVDIENSTSRAIENDMLGPDAD